MHGSHRAAALSASAINSLVFLSNERKPGTRRLSNQSCEHAAGARRRLPSPIFSSESHRLGSRAVSHIGSMHPLHGLAGYGGMRSIIISIIICIMAMRSSIIL